MIPDDVLHEIATAPDDLPRLDRPEDVAIYLKSFHLGRPQQVEIDRARAFGAIRRAAEVARAMDAESFSTWRRFVVAVEASSGTRLRRRGKHDAES